ncbi:hypothetical protein CGI04_13720 [Vibrio parahaemolyticus]|uniref:hypothetical protein n=1 Tax=Vibrio parahaemolyticus TaxID=670 RepID=UPI0011216B9E|nr:hypothetical protein [Vibrio parahaemolyticus]TOL18134.1 hypothetical protein CGI04_13720 [Vibrio parahaemolyticus]
MSDDGYGEVKTRKNFYPSDARKIVATGTVGILISQSLVSDKTKDILNNGKITLYEGVEPHEIDRLREIVEKELKNKEIHDKESEK